MQSGESRPENRHMQDTVLAARLMGISEHTFQRLTACVYTRDLLYGTFKEKLGGDLPAGLSGVQGYLLAQDREGLSTLALRLGCVCYAQTILSVIAGETLRKLADLTTPYVMQDAAWGSTFSSPSKGPENLDQLVPLMRNSGLACLRVWCEGQPAAVGRRVSLSLPAQEDEEPVMPENPKLLVEAFVTEQFGHG